MKLRYFAVVFCLISAVTLAKDPPTPLNPQPIGKCVLKISDKCMEDDGANGVKLSTCNGAESQNFVMRGTGTIKSPDGRCLEVLNGILKLKLCNASPAQQFEILSSGQVKQTNTNNCIDGQGGKLVMFICFQCQFIYQAFKMTCAALPVVKPTDPATQPSFCILETLGKCIGPIKGTYETGAALGVQVCSNPKPVSTVSNGAIKTPSGLCWEAQKNVAYDTDFPVVLLKPCDGSLAQKWTFRNSGQIFNWAFSDLSDRDNQYCADIKGGGNADGTPMIMYPCRDTNFANQNFGSDCLA